MRLKIPEPLSSCLREIGEVGGKSVYLVGGFVRDLLLKRPSFDIDIVVEGDAILIAEVMCERWNGTLHVHRQFGTATVTSENPNYPKVDFVTARRETYQRSGTLPIVKPATIIDDLQRRDFSINALGIQLGGEGFGTLIDETCGLADLKNGTIRVLHARSFLDDPTRIFRALRYAGRYGFKIADDDEPRMQEALPGLVELSGERIRNEINRVLEEENAPEIIQQLAQLGIFETIFDGWKISPMFTRRFEHTQQAFVWALEHLGDELFLRERVRWMALFGKELPVYQIEAISFRLVLEHQLRRVISRSYASQHGASLEITQAMNCQISHRESLWNALEKLGLSIAQDAAVKNQNGQWVIVDTQNRKTYVCGDGNLYLVETPLTAYRQLVDALRQLTPAAKPSEVYQLLKTYPVEALVLTHQNRSVPHLQRKQIVNYLLTLRKIPSLVTGRDLIDWGEKPGNSFELLLQRLFAAQLDGKFTTKSEAYSLLQKMKKE